MLEFVLIVLNCDYKNTRIAGHGKPQGMTQLPIFTLGTQEENLNQ